MKREWGKFPGMKHGCFLRFERSLSVPEEMVSPPCQPGDEWVCVNICTSKQRSG